MRASALARQRGLGATGSAAASRAPPTASSAAALAPQQAQ